MRNTSGRMLSLDVFRGITIAGMILVNNPGSWQYVYPPLRHASWNGCTPTDLIFPFFLFIAGVAAALSLTKRINEGASQTPLLSKIFMRSIIIFIIGLFLNTFPSFDLSKIRIPGVLQRIAIVYFITSVIFLKAEWKVIASLTILFLILYWGVITNVYVPGFGAPDLSRPVIIDPQTGEKIAPNIAAWLDNKLLGGHLWGATKIWDPEGILTTLPAISTCLLGVLLGKFLLTGINPIRKIIWILISGNLLIFSGLIWNISFPFNKSLWTSSYVLLTGGIALNFFALCYWLADIKKIIWWTKPFVVYGMNAILVYFLSGIFIRILNFIKISDAEGNQSGLASAIYQSWFAPLFSQYNASLAWAVSYVLFWLFIMWMFYIKKIFIKI